MLLLLLLLLLLLHSVVVVDVVVVVVVTTAAVAVVATVATTAHPLPTPRGHRLSCEAASASSFSRPPHPGGGWGERRCRAVGAWLRHASGRRLYQPVFPLRAGGPLSHWVKVETGPGAGPPQWRAGASIDPVVNEGRYGSLAPEAPAGRCQQLLDWHDSGGTGDQWHGNAAGTGPGRWC